MSKHLRSNVIGYVALFCFAIGGVAQALPGKNTVDTGDIGKGQVKKGDLAQNSVDGSKVVDNSLQGADVDEASLNIPQQALPTSLPPSGAAGGDLSGSYPNPQVQESGLVPGGDLSGTLSNAQVAEAGLTAGGDITGTLNATSIANNSIGGQEPDIATSDEIVNNSVDSFDVRDNNLTTADIAQNTLTGGDISDGDTIDDAELDDSTQTIQIGAPELVGAAIAEPAATSPDIGVAGNSSVLLFDQNTDEAIRLPVRIPADRVSNGGIDVSLFWSADATGGFSATWHLEFAAATRANDPVDQTLTDSDSGSQSNGTANRLQQFDFGIPGTPDIPGASVTDFDLLQLRISRNADAGTDTIPAEAALHLVEISYTSER